jgi:hypothetical protein
LLLSWLGYFKWYKVRGQFPRELHLLSTKREGCSGPSMGMVNKIRNLIIEEPLQAASEEWSDHMALILNLYRDQCGLDLTTPMVWHKKAKPVIPINDIVLDSPCRITMDSNKNS